MNQKGFANIIVIIGLVILVGITGYFVVNNRISPKPVEGISSFDECAKAGYPVGESNPRQCWTPGPNGRHFWEEPTPSPTPISGVSPKAGPITIVGEITCLPKKGSGPMTEECGIGLMGTDGLYYGLKSLFKLDTEYKFSVTGLRVEVSGTFNYEEMQAPAGNKYDVVGTIDVISIKKIGQ